MIGFFETGISIFGLNVANLIFRYVAYKDAVHEDIRRLDESQKHARQRAMPWARGPSSKRLPSGHIDNMSEDGHTLGGGELLADFWTCSSFFAKVSVLALFSSLGYILWIDGAVWASGL